MSKLNREGMPGKTNYSKTFTAALLTLSSVLPVLVSGRLLSCQVHQEFLGNGPRCL